jgi:hypothetical protein
MADTIPDVQLSNTQFTDINTVSGIVAGTAIVISNKTSAYGRNGESDFLIQISASQPANDSKDGEILPPSPAANSVKFISSGENTVWAKSLGDSDDEFISVQDNT